MTQPPADAASSSSSLNLSLRLDDVGVAFGSGLVATAVLLSTIYSRAKHDLDWSNFSMGILATLGLLGVAGVAHLLVRDPERQANLMAWPGAFGAISAGLMIEVAMDYNDASWYVAGLATAALSVGGYYLVRRGAFVLSTISGLLVLYGNLFDDVFGIDGDGDNFGMLAAAAILLFAAAVTVAGWSLPTRDLSAVVVGAAAGVANLVVLYALYLVGIFSAFGDGFDESLEGGGPPARFDGYDNDVWVILLTSLALCAGWAWCNWQTGHVGYRLLIAANLLSVIPVATIVLAVEHPTYWEAVAGAVGAAVLGFVGLRAIGGLGNLPKLKASSDA
jgi:hypothetical protein